MYLPAMQCTPMIWCVWKHFDFVVWLKHPGVYLNLLKNVEHFVVAVQYDMYWTTSSWASVCLYYNLVDKQMLWGTGFSGIVPPGNRRSRKSCSLGLLWRWGSECMHPFCKWPPGAEPFIHLSNWCLHEMSTNRMRCYQLQVMQTNAPCESVISVTVLSKLWHCGCDWTKSRTVIECSSTLSMKHVQSTTNAVVP